MEKEQLMIISETFVDIAIKYFRPILVDKITDHLLYELNGLREVNEKDDQGADVHSEE